MTSITIPQDQIDACWRDSISEDWNAALIVRSLQELSRDQDKHARRKAAAQAPFMRKQEARGRRAQRRHNRQRQIAGARELALALIVIPDSGPSRPGAKERQTRVSVGPRSMRRSTRTLPQKRDRWKNSDVLAAMSTEDLLVPV